VELWLHANQDEDMAERYGAMRTKYFARAGNAFRRVFDHLGLAPRISPEELAMGLTSTTVGLAIQSGGSMGTKAREEFMSAVFEGNIVHRGGGRVSGRKSDRAVQGSDPGWLLLGRMS
jgi:hypothetical protein